MIKILLSIVILSISLSSDQLTEEKSNQIKNLLESKKNYAPDFKLKDSNDSLYVLSELKGKVVLINFWATWCGPCRYEIPDFIDLYNKYNDKGFEILGISLSDSKAALQNFAKGYKVNYPLLYGNNREITKITSDYGGVPAVPWSFLVGIDGQIIATYPGAILKNYDPATYFSLEQNIISEISKINQESK